MARCDGLGRSWGRGPLAQIRLLGFIHPSFFSPHILSFMCGGKLGYHVTQCVKLTFFVYDELMVNAKEKSSSTPPTAKETLF